MDHPNIPDLLNEKENQRIADLTSELEKIKEDFDRLKTEKAEKDDVIIQLQNDLKNKDDEIKKLKEDAATSGTTATPQQTDSFAECESAYKQFIRFRLSLVIYFIRLFLIGKKDFEAEAYKIDELFFLSYADFAELVKMQQDDKNFPAKHKNNGLLVSTLHGPSFLEYLRDEYFPVTTLWPLDAAKQIGNNLKIYITCKRFWFRFVCGLLVLAISYVSKVIAKFVGSDQTSVEKVKVWLDYYQSVDFFVCCIPLNTLLTTIYGYSYILCLGFSTWQADTLFNLLNTNSTWSNNSTLNNSLQLPSDNATWNPLLGNFLLQLPSENSTGNPLLEDFSLQLPSENSTWNWNPLLKNF